MCLRTSVWSSYLRLLIHNLDPYIFRLLIGSATKIRANRSIHRHIFLDGTKYMVPSKTNFSFINSPFLTSEFFSIQYDQSVERSMLHPYPISVIRLYIYLKRRNTTHLFQYTLYLQFLSATYTYIYCHYKVFQDLIILTKSHMASTNINVRRQFDLIWGIY